MTISATSTTEAAGPDINQQAGKLLQRVAGYVGSRTTQLGLRAGLVDALANADDGLTADELAIQGRHRVGLRELEGGRPMPDYPALDALEADLLGVYVHLWAITQALDAQTPVGRPLSPACRVCAGETVRMRQAIKKPVGGRRVVLAWICEQCDRADSGSRLPRGWTA